MAESYTHTRPNIASAGDPQQYQHDHAADEHATDVIMIHVLLRTARFNFSICCYFVKRSLSRQRLNVGGARWYGPARYFTNHTPSVRGRSISSSLPLRHPDPVGLLVAAPHARGDGDHVPYFDAILWTPSCVGHRRGSHLSWCSGLRGGPYARLSADLAPPAFNRSGC